MKSASKAKQPVKKAVKKVPVAHKTTAKKPAPHKTAKKVAVKHPVHKARAHATPVKKKSSSTTVKKVATLGGRCTWLAFGIEKPWYLLGRQRISSVAKRAGYVPGLIQPGAVIGLLYPDGYHAARVLDASGDFMTVDLWGAATVLNIDYAQEVWVKEGH